MADASEELLINDPTVFVAVWGTAAWSPLAEHVHCSNTWVGGTPPPECGLPLLRTSDIGVQRSSWCFAPMLFFKEKPQWSFSCS